MAIDVGDICRWILDTGLAGDGEQALLNGTAERLRALGVPLTRANMVCDTLHPILEGHAFRWRSGEEETAVIAYGRDHDPDSWAGSPFNHLEQSGAPMLLRLLSPATDGEFDYLAELRAEGQTGYLATIVRFGGTGGDGIGVGGMECVYVSWITDHPGGFGEADVAAVLAVMPSLGLAMRAASLSGIAHTIARTYLGRDVARQVMSGRIVRGVAEKRDAVLWFSDLRDWTRISGSLPPDQVIPFLNDHVEPVVAAIHAEGGEVLKFMGDGILAVFPADDRQAATERALAAAAAARQGLRDLARMREGAGLPSTGLYLALHVGSVFYGNVGGPDRLDFTVVGPAVNEVARISAMCRSVDRNLLLSQAFVDALDGAGHQVASVGRFALRGVEVVQHLYTPDA
ncbi:adenylate/guanylate cyclase domain-containing protein [Tistrella mobilis]|uniref:adenylate/guanylate cyclase domain-containing protein n=1 Tax=Tistrella mobilis TaxID=171437 RepID=UPI0035588839